MTAVNATRESRSNAKPLKIELTLDLLIRAERDGDFITALDAFSEYGDMSFHSSISSLRGMGIRFDQTPHKHKHRHGGVARFQAYRISEKSRAAALHLRQHYESARMGSL